jgi:hypothetical protein
VAPTLTLATAATGTVSGAFTVTATFSNPVTGFTAADLTVGNGTASALAGSGTSYTFTVTPTGDGTVTIDAAAGAATDAAGNASTAAAQLSRTVDSSRPTVALATAAPEPTNGSIAVTVTFSEPVAGFTTADVTVTNGSVSGFGGTGPSYTFTVDPSSAGAVEVEVDVAASVATDAAGNGNTAATPLVRTYDRIAPVTTFSAHPDASTSATSASFAFTADEQTAFECSLDGAAFASCTSPVSFAGLETGGHRLVVRALDAAGNSSENAYTWTSAVPVVTFALRPVDTSAENVGFTWSATGTGVTYTCRLDTRPAAPCTSPIAYADLAEGDHSFTVTAAGGLTGSSTVTWTVQRPQAPPAPSAGGASRPASVAIIPTIDPSDLLGRPQGFKQSTDGAPSQGPFTRRLKVKLRIPTPEEGADHVFVSSYADFREGSVFAVRRDELYDWTLLAGDSGDRKVWVRFDDTADAPVGTATIVLDQELPVLRPTFLRSAKHIAAAAKAQRKVRGAAAYCGASGRRWIAARAGDRFSGLNAVQIAADPKHPCAWRPFLPTLTYRLPGRVVYLRVEDRVGNIGRWYRLKTPR